VKKFISALVLILAVSGGVYYYGNTGGKSEMRILETAVAERGSVRGVLVATGIIKPQVGAVVKVGTRATGTIVEMRVKIGDRVSQGQLIALIDDREILRAIEQQNAAILAARGAIAQIERTYPERIREARANYEYAKVSFERQSRLARTESTSLDALDKARSQLAATEATLKRLQDEQETQLKIARATLQEHEAQLRQQEVKLTYTRIHAPIDGVVSDVTLQQGETTVAGLQVANLVTVLDPTLLEMWSYVDETDIGRVRVGQPVEYYVDTYPSRLFLGTIERVNPQPVVKENIVYYLAIVKVPRDDAAFLKPEMTTHIKIVYDERQDVTSVPNDAVKFEGGRQIAYRVTGPSSAEPVGLKIGIRGEDRTEILEGVEPGDVLATKLILPGGGPAGPGRPQGPPR
jgi:multidrug efflux pump subunit AcrA (membrane-fusion protein)